MKPVSLDFRTWGTAKQGIALAFSTLLSLPQFLSAVEFRGCGRALTSRLFVFLLALSPAGVTADGNVVRIQESSPPRSFDPAYSTAIIDEQIGNALFEGLTTFDRDNQITGGQALSWTISESQKNYTFTLREGLRWSDGQPVSTKDFVLAFQRVVDPNVAKRPKDDIMMGLIRNASQIARGELPVEALGVAAVSPTTLNIELEVPDPFFLETLTTANFFPVPSHVYDRVGEQWAEQKPPVGNGPFLIQPTKKPNRTLLVRNPLYRVASNVKGSSVELVHIDDRRRLLSMLERGEIDIVNTYQLGSLQNWASEVFKMRVVLQDVPGNLVYISINLQDAELEQDSVRSALDLALDREALRVRTGKHDTTTAVAGKLVTYRNEFEKSSRRKLEKSSAKLRTKKLERARSLMAEAGYGPTKPLKVSYIYYASKTNDAFMRGLRAMWRSIYVEIVPESLTLEGFYKRLNAGDYQLGRASFAPTSKDPWATLSRLHSSVQGNYPRFQNARYDELADQLRAEADPVEREGLTARLESIIRAERPLIPVYHEWQAFVARSEVADSAVYSAGRLQLRFLESVQSGASGGEQAATALIE